MFGWLKGSAKLVDAAGDLISAIPGGIDKAIFNEQEKATFFMDWLKTMAGENSAQALARRQIAIVFLVWFLSVITFAIGIYPFNPEYAKFIITTLVSIEAGWAFVAIMGTYFTGHYVREWARRKKE